MYSSTHVHKNPAATYVRNVYCTLDRQRDVLRADVARGITAIRLTIVMSSPYVCTRGGDNVRDLFRNVV